MERKTKATIMLVRIIPRKHRVLLLGEGQRSRDLARYYLTLFSLYRFIQVSGKLDLSSITQALSEVVPSSHLPFVSVSIDKMVGLADIFRRLPALKGIPLMLRFSHHLSWSSSPNSVRGPS